MLAALILYTWTCGEEAEATMALSADATRVIQEGQHDPAFYVSLCHALTVAGRSGILEVRVASHFRRLYLLGGLPAWYVSDIRGETLAESMVRGGVIDAGRMDWFVQRLEPGASLRIELIRSGEVRQELLERHEQRLVEAGYTASLGWRGGRWSFECCDAVGAGMVDPDLRMPVDPQRLLWEGVLRHLPAEDIIAYGESRNDQVVMGTSDLPPLIPRLGLQMDLAAALGSLDGAHTLGQVVAEAPDHRDAALRLLWYLERIGALMIDGDEAGLTRMDGLDWVFADEHLSVLMAPLSGDDLVGDGEAGADDGPASGDVEIEISEED